MMYEVLITRIRYHIQKADFMGLKEHEGTLLLNEAADAIEELQKRVPKTPHGRLIDADAMMKQIEHDTPLSSTFEKVMRWYTENAPTIIESEGE